MGLSPRASTSDSNEPLVFLRDVGKAYRASGRTTPIMDQLSVHPYPNPSSPTDGPEVGYPNPDRFGVPNLDRVKQAVYDAFNGTGQPTTLERPHVRDRRDRLADGHDRDAAVRQRRERHGDQRADSRRTYLKTLDHEVLRLRPDGRRCPALPARRREVPQRPRRDRQVHRRRLAERPPHRGRRRRLAAEAGLRADWRRSSPRGARPAPGRWSPGPGQGRQGRSRQEARKKVVKKP